MKRLMTAFVLALAVIAAAAETYWGTVMTRSYHANRAKGYNESNFGLGVEVREGELRAGLGSFANSYYKTSNILYVSYLPWEIGPVRAGLRAGAVSGYPMYDGRYGPFYNLLLEYNICKAFSADLIVIAPSKTDTPTGAVALQLKASY